MWFFVWEGTKTDGDETIGLDTSHCATIWQILYLLSSSPYECSFLV